jgi:phage terminase large subunit
MSDNPQVGIIPYCSRPQFLPFHARTDRWAVLVCHRRCGKTVAAINELIKAAWTCDKPEGRFGYVSPLYNQSKDVAWAYLKRYAQPLLICEPNESELRVDLRNGSRIRLYGADNPDRLRGLYLDGLVADEFADWRSGVWAEVLRPSLADRQGWGVFIGTPKGKNEFWQLWEDAKKKPDWYRLMLKASDTGLIGQRELADARINMSLDQFEQEFSCSFEAALQGAYYAEEIRRAQEDGRIGQVPIDRGVKVHTGWDLGKTDSTAIWFIQAVGKERRLIDYYETSGVGFDHYAKVLKEKDYVYGDHYFPHDLAHDMIGMDRSRVDTLRALGIEPTIVAQGDVNDGINAVRRMLGQCWIDEERCGRGFEALKQYRREWDDKLKDWKSRPYHGWPSHGADALRTFAVGYEDRPSIIPKLHRYKEQGPNSWMSG